MKPERNAATFATPRRKAHFFAALAALLVVAGASNAAAENPWDVEQRRLAAEASRQGRAPRGILPLVEMWREWDRATPAETQALFTRLSTDRRLSPDRRAYAAMLAARGRLRTGDAAASDRAFQELGYVTSWRVVGPFDNEGKQGFATEMPPEALRLEAVDMEARWPGRERPVGWRLYPELSRFGYVNFDAVFRPNVNVCGFAETIVTSERAQALAVWVGAGGAVKMWWNGEQVLEDAAYRQPDPDRHVAMVGARQGANRLLVKVCAAESTWGFFARLADANGAAARGITVDPSAQAPTERGHASLRLPRAPRTALEALEAAAAGERASAQALEDLARFLTYTGADDPAEHRARQLAARAADREPTVERLTLAAQLAEERGEAMRFGAVAEQRFPDQPESILLRARIRANGAAPEEALPLLDRLPREGKVAMRAAEIRAAVLTTIGLDETALAVLERAAREARGAPYWLRTLAEASAAANHVDRSIELREASVAARWDDVATRRNLIGDAIWRRELPRVMEHVDALRTIASDNTDNLTYIADVLESLGRTDEAIELYGQARALAPDDADVVSGYGRLMLRLDRRDAAAEAFRTVLLLRPQDAPTRELLEQIRPERRVDEAYAIESRALLARRGEGNGFPHTVLQDLTVNTVYENGLGSSFRQIAAEIHDTEGARSWRTYSIQYDPDSQRVDVRGARVYRGQRVLEANQTFEQQLGEPWYRIYYDTRALVVVFPDLEPGDVVELRYRIDDVAHRNLFADYYGDLHFLQGFAPVKRADYVLITPSSRQFHFNEPRLRGLRHEQRADGARRIDHFFATDIEAIRQEDGMPGMTEVAPYLHVSTYRTWNDVGRWWWGLVKDQLYADESLRSTVAELVRGAPDTRTKVVRIHNWVVRNTRYVGLEFGIHGYKPYRVPQIVRRGFGDCKDKASLLFTMFREAGIDAHMVLLRTRRNGAITDLPASLAVFDHAIAYVPELDLYLDGTAEHSGTTELPQMDQGVTVLHVWPNGAELRRTPVLDPDRNRRSREIQIRLSRDGTGEIDVREEVRGGEASGYRSTYQAEGTREERFERSMRSLFPGMDLESLAFENIGDLETPVRFRYRARVPQIAQSDGGTGLRMAPTVLDDLVRRLARTPTRRHPLDLGGTSAYVEDRTVVLPAGMRAAEVPTAGEAASEFGRLRLAVESNGREVQTRTELELRRDRVAPNEYPAFRRWVQEADALLRQRLGIQGGAR